jgi:hypothetical protein
MNFLKKIFESKSDSSDVDSIKRDLSDCLKKLINTLNDINTTELDKNMNRGLYAAVKESRSKFTIKLQENLEKIQVPENNDYDSLKEMHFSLNSILETIKKGNLKYSYYLGYVFGNKMNLLGGQFKLFVDSTNTLGEYLRIIEEKKFPEERIKYMKSSIISFDDKVKVLENKLSYLSESKKIKSEELITLKKDLKSTDSNIAIRLLELNEEKEKSISRVFSLINPVNRAFKKYEKQGVFDKSTGKILLMYIEDPLKAACLDKEQSLRVITEGLIKLIDSGQLNVKESAKLKVMELNNNLNNIPAFVKEIEELDEKIGHLEKIRGAEENKISSLKSSVISAENSIALINKEIEFTEKSITEDKQEIENLNKEISKLKQDENKIK